MTKSFVLNNNLKLPAVGLGTFQIKSRNDVEIAIDTGLSCGYRLFDTAAVYKNERAIGDCLPDLLKKHGLRRSDVFITTKLGPRDMSASSVTSGLTESLGNLQMDYVDLYLIHWPGKQGLKHNDTRNKTHRKEAWKAMEEVYLNSGKVKAVGVSNYTVEHLRDLLSYCEVVPAVLQSEFHPDHLDAEVRSLCNEKGIHFQSYSSLGQKKLLTGDHFCSYCDVYSKSLPQILLKWCLQNGCSVIPMSKNPLHIKENISIFDFSISNEHMNAIRDLGRQKKYAWNSQTIS